MRRGIEHPEDTFLVDIISKFKEANCSYLQVLDENNALSGIISFRDIRLVLQEEQMGYLVVAKEVATSPVVTVTSDQDVETALRRMGQTGVSQLPVVDLTDSHNVIGVIYEKDITAAYDRESISLNLDL